MRSRVLVAGVLALAPFLVAPVAAPAQPSAAVASATPPIGLTACEITRRERGRSSLSPYPLPITGGLRLTFADRANVGATLIRVFVDYRGEAETIEDAGTFSPGATINHTFDNFSDYAYLGPRPNACRVVFVRFTDGSVWAAPRTQRRANAE
jgi:hypothetical protein